MAGSNGISCSAIRSIEPFDLRDLTEARPPVELLGQDRKISVLSGDHRIGEEAAATFRQPSRARQINPARRRPLEEFCHRHIDQSERPLLVSDQRADLFANRAPPALHQESQHRPVLGVSVDWPGFLEGLRISDSFGLTSKLFH